ncbi:hypothetical protein C0995_004741 [Termitomyces sp. Mi166|nr:hypothetical protein C0995_004741 [Termitomyces sp. Mi166\
MWEEYSQRFAKAEEQRALVESPAEKPNRLSRLENAKAHGYSKRSTVFEWEQDEGETTFYRRKRVPKSLVEDVWHDYSPSQRRYWSHLDECDLCPQVKADRSPSPLYDDDGDEDGLSCEVPVIDDSPSAHETTEPTVGPGMLKHAQALIQAKIIDSTPTTQKMGELDS